MMVMMIMVMIMVMMIVVMTMSLYHHRARFFKLELYPNETILKPVTTMLYDLLGFLNEPEAFPNFIAPHKTLQFKTGIGTKD